MFVSYFENFDVFLSHVLIFANGAFRLILGVLTFTKFVEFIPNSCYFLTFQPQDMFKLSFNLNISQYMLINIILINKRVYLFYYNRTIWLINSWSEPEKEHEANICYCTFEDCFVKSEHVFPNWYGTIEGQFIMPRVIILQYFLCILLIHIFLLSADLKRAERSRPAKLVDF